ncbi:MAG: hypothetical protein ACYCPP_07360 [Nitrososphaerales archaeon]
MSWTIVARSGLVKVSKARKRYTDVYQEKVGLHNLLQIPMDKSRSSFVLCISHQFI